MGLEQDLLGLSLAERISYDESRNTLFANFEGLQVRTIEDVELIRREFERTCRAIGRKVHLIVNYDGFALDEAVSEAYFSTITYLQQRYYETASRYTTSAFMRLKLGAASATATSPRTCSRRRRGPRALRRQNTPAVQGAMAFPVRQWRIPSLRSDWRRAPALSDHESPFPGPLGRTPSSRTLRAASRS